MDPAESESQGFVRELRDLSPVPIALGFAVIAAVVIVLVGIWWLLAAIPVLLIVTGGAAWRRALVGQRAAALKALTEREEQDREAAMRRPRLRISCGTGEEFQKWMAVDEQIRAEFRASLRVPGAERIPSLAAADLRAVAVTLLRVAELTGSAAALNVQVRISDANPGPQEGQDSFPAELHWGATYYPGPVSIDLEPGARGYVSLHQTKVAGEGLGVLTSAFPYWNRLGTPVVFTAEVWANGEVADRRQFKFGPIATYGDDGRRFPPAHFPDIEEEGCP